MEFLKPKNPSWHPVPCTGGLAYAHAYAEEKAREAFRLRKSGVSVADIAVRFGCSLWTAYAYIEAGCTEYLEQFPEEKPQIRSMELARLDDMEAGIYEKACSGDTNAIDTVLNIMERRARLLGLDEPTRQEIETKPSAVSADDLTDDELAAIIRAGSRGTTDP